jgi:hypothetical protein
MERTIFLHISANKVSTQLGWLVIGLSPWMPRFDHGPVHVRSVVDKVILKEAFIGVLRFPSVSFQQSFTIISNIQGEHKVFP